MTLENYADDELRLELKQRDIQRKLEGLRNLIENRSHEITEIKTATSVREGDGGKAHHGHTITIEINGGYEEWTGGGGR